MMSKDPPPLRHPLIHHFGHAGLCRAQSKHIHQFQLSCYQFESIEGASRAVRAVCACGALRHPHWALQSPGSHDMPIDWIYRDVVPVGTSATSLQLTGATLLDDVSGPPPTRHPLIHHLAMLGSAEPKSSTLTNFSCHVTNLRVLGSAEPRIPRNANLRSATSL